MLVSAPSAIRSVIGGGEGGSMGAAGVIRSHAFHQATRSGHYRVKAANRMALGLAAALHQLAQQATRTAGVQVQVHVPEALPALPAAVEVAAYRISAEALTNTVQHAAAHTCDLTVSVDPAANALLVEVRDDGRGLAPDRPPGVGLGSMRERAAELGGRCDVATLPQGGTRVRARLPYRPVAQPPPPADPHRAPTLELPAGRP